MFDNYWNVVYCNKGLLFPEGQLPRGALYLDHKMNSKEAEMPYVSPNDICKSIFMEQRRIAFYSRGNALISVEWEGCWVLEQIWMLWRREDCLVAAGY
jgi:hypothetical protein